MVSFTSGFPAVPPALVLEIENAVGCVFITMFLSAPTTNPRHRGEASVSVALFVAASRIVPESDPVLA